MVDGPTYSAYEHYEDVRFKDKAAINDDYLNTVQVRGLLTQASFEAHKLDHVIFVTSLQQINKTTMMWLMG